MDRLGLNLPAGRRKAANVTLLTSLVEGKIYSNHDVKTFRLLLLSYISECSETNEKVLKNHLDKVTVGIRHLI